MVLYGADASRRQTRMLGFTVRVLQALDAVVAAALNAVEVFIAVGVDLTSRRGSQRAAGAAWRPNLSHAAIGFAVLLTRTMGIQRALAEERAFVMDADRIVVTVGVHSAAR